MRLDEAKKILKENGYMFENSLDYAVTSEDISNINKLLELIEEENLGADNYFVKYLDKLRKLKPGDVLDRFGALSYLQQDIMAAHEALDALYDCITYCMPKQERTSLIFKPGKYGEG